MSAKVLLVNFSFSVPEHEEASEQKYEEMVEPLAGQFAAVPGLLWKIWTINAAEHEAGGVYLFEDEKALKDFLGSPLAAAVMSNPAVSAFSAKPLDVIETLSAITRGPVPTGSIA